MYKISIGNCILILSLITNPDARNEVKQIMLHMLIFSARTVGVRIQSPRQALISDSQADGAQTSELRLVERRARKEAVCDFIGTEVDRTTREKKSFNV